MHRLKGQTLWDPLRSDWSLSCVKQLIIYRSIKAKLYGTHCGVIGHCPVLNSSLFTEVFALYRKANHVPSLVFVVIEYESIMLLLNWN